MIWAIKSLMIDIIKSLHWFPGFVLGSGLYLFFSFQRDAKRRLRDKHRHRRSHSNLSRLNHWRLFMLRNKKDSDFYKKYFPEEKEYGYISNRITERSHDKKHNITVISDRPREERMMIRFLYKKWIRRRCPHICACCKFKKDHYTECFTEMEQMERRARKNLGQWQYKGNPENIRRLGR